MDYRTSLDPQHSNFVDKFQLNISALKILNILSFEHLIPHTSGNSLFGYDYSRKDHIDSEGRFSQNIANYEALGDEYIDIPETLFYKVQGLAKMYQAVCLALSKKVEASIPAVPPLQLDDIYSQYKQGFRSGELTGLFHGHTLCRIPEKAVLYLNHSRAICGRGFHCMSGHTCNFSFCGDAYVHILPNVNELYQSYQDAYDKYLEQLIEACIVLPPEIYRLVYPDFTHRIKRYKAECTSTSKTQS